MANKKRRGHQRSARRAGVQAPGPTPVGAATATPASALTASTTPVTGAPRAVAGPRNAPIIAPRRSAGAAVAAIDIDARVPYFTSDLRRIGITAGVMVVGIVVASFILK